MGLYRLNRNCHVFELHYLFWMINILLSSVSARQDSVLVFVTQWGPEPKNYKQLASYFDENGVFHDVFGLTMHDIANVNTTVNFIDPSSEPKEQQVVLHSLIQKSTDPDAVVIILSSFQTQVYLPKFDQNFIKKLLGESGFRIFLAADEVQWWEDGIEDRAANSSVVYASTVGIIGFLRDVGRLYDELLSDRSTRPPNMEMLWRRAACNVQIKEKFHIGIDSNRNFFQSLDYSTGQLVPVKNGRLLNKRTKTKPIFTIMRPPYQLASMRFNRIMGIVSSHSSSKASAQFSITKKLKKNEHPLILLAVFVFKRALFIEEFFMTITRLSYPKDKILLLVQYEEPELKPVFDVLKLEEMKQYRVVKVLHVLQTDASRPVFLCKGYGCKYIFYLHPSVVIENYALLISLVQRNSLVIAPYLREMNRSVPGQHYSNTIPLILLVAMEVTICSKHI